MSMFHRKANKSFFKKAIFSTPLDCCPDEVPCCTDDTPVNDPTPPTNCAWSLALISNTDQLASIPSPLESAYTFDAGQVEVDSEAAITFEATALASPIGNITVLTSGATGLDGSSTYVGATPVIAVSTSDTVGTLTLDTETPGEYSVIVTIETDCSSVAVTVNYEVIVAP